MFLAVTRHVEAVNISALTHPSPHDVQSVVNTGVYSTVQYSTVFRLLPGLSRGREPEQGGYVGQKDIILKYYNNIYNITNHTVTAMDFLILKVSSEFLFFLLLDKISQNISLFIIN